MGVERGICPRQNDTKEAVKRSDNTAMLQLLSETRDYIDAVRQSALGSEIVLRKLNAVLAQQQHS